MATRRSNGAGSIYPMNTARTRWAAAVSLPGGERVTRTASHPDPHQAERKAQALLDELRLSQRQQTLTPPTDLTLTEWVARWLAGIAQARRPSTLATYQAALGLIVAQAGARRLDRLTPLLLADVFTRLQRQGHGSRRLQQAHTTLRSCLEQAVTLGVLGSNPMTRVGRPQRQVKPVAYWTVAEARAFLTTALHPPNPQMRWGPCLALLVSTGLRISEALALTWADVDLGRRRLSVTKALVWTGTTATLQTPKTKAGRRVLSLSETACQALAQLPPGGGGSRIFVTAGGTSPHRDHLRQPLATLCRHADVPVINIHGLRHVHAMLALEAGADPYVVQRRLGHSHVSITLGIYGYSRRDDGDLAASLDRLLA